MTSAQKTSAAGLVSGIFFGAGLVLSGMTLPTKVIGFLDMFGGAWDPSLALVMAGAILVHTVVYHLVKGRPSPLFAERWSLPTRKDIDGRLLLGAALFGVGWGLGGFCPGPGIVSLVGGAASSAVFVFTMLVAMALTARVEEHLSKRERVPKPSTSTTSDAQPSGSA